MRCQQSHSCSKRATAAVSACDVRRTDNTAASSGSDAAGSLAGAEETGKREGDRSPVAGTGEEAITVRPSKFSPRDGEQNADTPRQVGLAGLIVLASGRLHGLEPQPAATVSVCSGSGPSAPRRTCRVLPIRNSCRSVPDLRAAYRRTVPSRAWPPRHAG